MLLSGSQNSEFYSKGHEQLWWNFKQGSDMTGFCFTNSGYSEQTKRTICKDSGRGGILVSVAIAGIKHHDHKQPGEEMAYFSLVIVSPSSREVRIGTQEG